MRFVVVPDWGMISRLFVTGMLMASCFFGQTVSANAAVEGEWAGTVFCSRNKNMDIRLLITKRGGRLAATMETKSSRVFLGKVWPHKLVGRYDARKGGYLFVPEHRSLGPRGVSKGFMLLPGRKGSRARGEVLNDQCRFFSVERITANSPSRRLSIKRPSNGGHYFAANSLQKRCDAILNWAQKIDKEFFGFSMRRNTMSRIYQKAILLYADNSFVPVFGQSFDRIDGKKLQAVWEDQWSNCSKDPFLRQRGGWVWRHAFFNALRKGNKRNYYAGAFSKASIVQHISKIRRVHNEIKFSRPAAVRNYMARIKRLERIEKEVSRNESLFWPSEQADLVGVAKQRIHKLATARADQFFVKLAKTNDPHEGLRLVRNSLLSGQGDFLDHIESSQRMAVRGEITSYQKRFSRQLEGPIIKKVKSAPNTIAGAGLLHRIATGQYKSIDSMSYQISRKIKVLAGARRDEILKVEIPADLDILGNYRGGRAGLAASTKWINAFSVKYKIFENLKQVKRAHRHFIKDRSVRLREALSEFEATLAKINPGSRGAAEKAKRVMSRYLSWQGDRQLPEYFLYEEALSRYN